MARREPKPTKALEVSVMFEPSHVAPACVAQAYEAGRADHAPCGTYRPPHSRAGRERAHATCRKGHTHDDENAGRLYARVSSERQAEAHTVESQVAALRERIVRRRLHLPDELQFIDEGFSGATLVRPALERLRDAVAIGAVDRLYVHSPDRLARKYAYQVLLVDEFQRAGVEVVFLNRELGQTPEDELLLQVQGMMAEYERAKILERHRRGKRHAAHAGAVNVLVAAPYGYRYIPKHHGGGQARYEIVAEEARVVRQMFDVGRP